MDGEITQLHHPNSIWYTIGIERWWYIPYLDRLERIKAGLWRVHFGNTDPSDIDLRSSASILFYGANNKTGALPLTFLTECAKYSVSVLVHQNHVTKTMVFYCNEYTGRTDTLTQQILHRENSKQRAYIARILIKNLWKSREWLGPCTSSFSTLASKRTTEDVMVMEAGAARQYWEVFYRKAGVPGLSRRELHPLNSSLDALSHFLSGITLRWIIAHGMSPAHGFLHKQTSYTGLVYDLMELTRSWTEEAVLISWLADSNQESLTQRATRHFKNMLDDPITTQPTRQRIYRRGLIQGSVIALKHYLTGAMRAFLPPVVEKDTPRGRKRNVSYSLPGEIWK